MKLVVDMNLSPEWIPLLRSHGHDAMHWAEVGDVRAPDAEIMAWARSSGAVVITHDLDFGILLALTSATGPSVIQVRVHDTLPFAIGGLVLAVLEDHSEALGNGALVTVDPRGARIRVLPIAR